MNRLYINKDWSTLKKLIFLNAAKNGATPKTETLSGSIVTFSTTKALPLIECMASIEPVQAGSGEPSPENIRPITGWTGAKVTRTGKNLAYVFNDGYVPSTSTGQLVQYSGARTDYIKIEPSKPYYEKVDPSTEQFFILFYDTNKGFIKYNAGTEYITVTSPSNAAYAMLRVSETQLANSQIQLEQNNQATPYEPYSGTTYSITFPNEAGTVYGGSLDVTNGVLTVTDGYIESYNGETLPGEWISDRDVYAVGNMPTTGAQIVYELATPITYQLTPQGITTLIGTNNVWSDTGNITVTYSK